MSFDIEKLNYFTEETLPRGKTLVAGVVTLLVLYSSLNSFLGDFFDLKTRVVIYSSILILWVIFWLYKKYYLPRNKKRKVGVVIAIHSENEKERQRLKADFLTKLRMDFQDEGVLEFAHIVFLQNHFSEQIKDADDPKKKIENFNKKIKGHFYVWGDVKKRPDGEEGEKYFIHFQGYVVHKPIPLDLSKKISIDFSKVLPTEVNFLVNRGFRGFEASATIVHLAAKYIIGIAAFVSQDPQLALKLHSGLQEQFNAFRPLPPHLQEIRNHIPKLISDENYWIARWHFQNQRNEEAKNFLKTAFDSNNNNYGAWLLKAIIEFQVDNDPETALESVKKARRYSINTFEWRYSEAFLYFWKGAYQEALKTCQKIRSQSYVTEGITLQEVREFTLNILKQNESKVQLFFWMGYLAYFKDQNLGNALEYFEHFEKDADTSMAILKDKSTVYLTDIKRRMSINK